MSDSDRRRLTGRLGAVLGPPGPQLTCEECFEQLDRYVDAGRSGEDPDAAVPGMATHLAGCPACNEDAESLHAWLDSEQQ